MAQCFRVTGLWKNYSRWLWQSVNHTKACSLVTWWQHWLVVSTLCSLHHVVDRCSMLNEIWDAREMIVDFRKWKYPLAPIIINGDSFERVDCFTFLGTIIPSDLGWGNNRDALVKKAQQRLFFLQLPKEVRTEEGDSPSVISFCYWEYPCFLNMCLARRHQPAPEEQAWQNGENSFQNCRLWTHLSNSYIQQ